MRTLHPLVQASTIARFKNNHFIQAIESAHSIERQPSFTGSPFSMVTGTESV